jgi:hypothetical protein
METFERRVRIVDVKVQQWGGMGPQAVACAGSVLREHELAVSATEQGKRIRMPFPLNPRTESVASSR